MKILIMAILILLFNINTTFAQGSIYITADNSNLSIDEEVSISINITNTQISSMTLEIFWDKTKLEYVKGPDNSNYLNDRVLYTWVNESGKDSNSITIDNFVFKSIQQGITNIVISGEFYNSNGDAVKIDSNSIELNIQNEVQENAQYYTEQEDVSDNNAYLKILRLNHEGISPVFDKNTFDYYFITKENLNSLEVTAVPEHQDAIVSIIGNNNLQFGENLITITVTSKDTTNNLVYNIYVTKTNDLEAVNANLENLAIKQGSIIPEFNTNTTKYNLEVTSNVDKLDVLAIPEDINATTRITGSDNLKTGSNKIEITVVAKNGTTFKKYEVDVYKRNEAEDKQIEEEQQIQQEQLSNLLGENNIDSDTKTKTNGGNKNSYIGPIITFIVLIVLLLTFAIMKKYKNK